jgi:hypothetical protein
MWNRGSNISWVGGCGVVWYGWEWRGGAAERGQNVRIKVKGYEWDLWTLWGQIKSFQNFSETS